MGGYAIITLKFLKIIKTKMKKVFLVLLGLAIIDGIGYAVFSPNSKIFKGALGDKIPPTVRISYSSGVPNNAYFDETLILRFSEPVDPRTINPLLTFGGTINNVSATNGCGVAIPSNVVQDFHIRNIGTLLNNFNSNHAIGIFGTATCSMNNRGNILTIIPHEDFYVWNQPATFGDIGPQIFSLNATTSVTDLAGNLLSGGTSDRYDF